MSLISFLEVARETDARVGDHDDRRIRTVTNTPGMEIGKADVEECDAYVVVQELADRIWIQ